MKVEELANVTGQAILDNLLDRRGIKQALQEVDADVLDELRQTIGDIALAAVAPLIQAEALERAAVRMAGRSDKHDQDAAIVLAAAKPNGMLLAQYQLKAAEARDGAAAIRAMKEGT